MANGEWGKKTRLSLLLPYSLFATPYSPLQHASADQCFDVPDVLPATLVGDGTDAGRARHRVAAEKQVIAGADQAGVEQYRIDVAEFAGLDSFGQQAAMKVQQGCDEEF